MKSIIIQRTLILSLCLFSFFCMNIEISAHGLKDVKLNHSKMTMKEGQTVKLSLKNAPKSKIKWSSDRKKIVKVNKSGKIKALKAGKAVVYAKYKGKKYKCTIKVKPIQVTQNPETKPDDAHTQNTEAENINVVTDIYVSDIIGNEYDWFVMINYVNGIKPQKFSNSFKSFENAEITLNGTKIDVSELKKGDKLEIGYTGQLSENTHTTFPNIKYVKVFRENG